MTLDVRSLAASLVLLGLSAARAQTPTPAPPPGADIWLASLERAGEAVRVGPLENITNRPGYDNQPAFTPDGQAALYSSMRDGQNDVYRYDIAARRTTQVTRTSESEYSPNVSPDGGVSVIRVEADRTQRLWRFEMDGSSPRVLLPDVKPVGYHAWIDKDTIALFVLGSPATPQRAGTPATLQIADVGAGKAETVASGIGRSLNRIPGRRAVSYLDRSNEKEWWIRSWDATSRATSPLVRVPPPTPGGVAMDGDFAWTPDGAILLSRGDALAVWRQGATGWTQVAVTRPPGLGAISRLSVSPKGDRLALVISERATP